MKRIALAILAVAFVLASVAPSFAVELQARGSWRVVGSFYDDVDFDGTKKDETFRAQQRARIWFDFVAHENLKAVLGLNIGNTRWGDPTNNGDIGSASRVIGVKHAYLDFNLPNTEINVRAGKQDFATPGNFGSTVLDDDVTGLVISAPVNDMVTITGGWLRSLDLIDGTQGGNAGSDDEVDTLVVMVPVTADGFSVTPYFLYTMGGKRTYGGSDDASLWHFGFSAEINLLDPVVILTDFTYGSQSEEFGGNELKTSGFVFDLAVDYKMDFMTPEVFFWYGSGEDTDTDSNVFPTIAPGVSWSTFGTDDSAVGESGILGDPTRLPIWAIGFRLKDLTFMENLSHTFTAYYAKGTSDDGTFWFDEDDALIEINVDSKYQIYDELAAYVELGYISLDLDGVDTDPAYKCALGLKYDF